MNKEQVYDEQINALMAQVIDICKEHKIALVASFAIPTEEDPDLVCSTFLIDDAHDPSDNFKKAASILGPRRSSLMQMTTRNKEGEITSVVMIAD